MPSIDSLTEARRSMEICNACRDCEGYCAVFPAMEMRRAFTDGDLGSLSNLCHNCKGCYYACQYAPPHAFGLNVPKAFAALRAETYEDHAWPRLMARLFQHNGLRTALTLAAAYLGSVALVSPDALYGFHIGRGAFYAVIPHGVMVSLFGAAFLFAVVAMTIGMLLAVHLGFVMGLFLVLPYGKFVHGLRRTAALVPNASEKESGAVAPTATQADLRT